MLVFNEKLYQILRAKQQKYVESFSYHTVNIEQLYAEVILELSSNSTGNNDESQDENYQILEIFNLLQNNLKKYILEMKKVFSWHLFMSEENFDKFHYRAVRLSISAEENNSLLTWTLTEYKKKYSEINQNIIRDEKEIFENTISPLVLKWYEDEYLEENALTLQEKHELLKKIAVDGIKNCLSFNDHHIVILKNHFDSLDKKLEQLYTKLKTRESQKSSIGVNPVTIVSNNYGSGSNFTENNFGVTIPLLSGSIPKLAVEFSSSGIKCGLMVDGKLEMVLNDDGTPNFPSKVEFRTRNQMLLFANGNIKDFFSIYCNFIHPNKQPVEDFKKYVKTPNGDIIIGEELVFALALEKVKRRAEVILKGEIEYVTIAFPLRYTTVKRQLIKDAAEIAGFKNVSLISETTAGAVTYFKGTQNSADDLRKTVLVLVDKKPHYDAALYRIQLGKIEMITCTGDFHNHQKKHELMKNHMARKFKKASLGGMIYCGNDQDLAISISRSLSCKLKTIKNAVLTGAAMFAGMEVVFNDLFPYKVKLKDAKTKNTVLKISRRFNLDETRRVHGRLTLTPSSSEAKKVQLTEEGVSTFSTGEFQFPVASKGDEIVACVVNDEGLLSVSQNNILIANHFSLEPKEIQLYSRYLQLKVKMEELQSLAKYLLRISENIPMAVPRDEIRKVAGDVIEFMKNGSPSLELLDQKLSFLLQLKNKNSV